MTQIKKFSDYGIKAPEMEFKGDKIKISRIFNRPVMVHHFRIGPSQIESKKGEASRCLTLQISINEENHIIFTGSEVMMDTIQKLPKNAFPFETTIINNSQRYEFT